MSQIVSRSSAFLGGSGYSYTRRLLYKTILPVGRQVRWESRVETANSKIGKEGRRSGNNGVVGDDTAALLMAQKRTGSSSGILGNGGREYGSEHDGRQTVRMATCSADSRPTEEARSSSFGADQTHQTSVSVEKGGQTKANTTNYSGGLIPELTDEEESRLESMRGAQKEIRDRLSEVVAHFSAPIKYAFAYGSGVYKQTGYGGEKTKPMVDMIFAVSHPDHWHALNISQNRPHYSFMATLGSNAVAFVQDKIGAGVYYNPFVEINGVVIKYGVVSMETLSNDLLNWDTLYLAGRMHKPTLTLRRDPLMRISKQVNLTHAVRAALLMLPKTFTTAELFRTIASISFSGDFRMKVGGENPNKVNNIVEAQLPLFKYRYSSIIEGLSNLEFIGQELLQQDMDPQARASMLRKMPNNFYDRLVRQGRRSGVKLPPGLGAETVNTIRLASMDNIDTLARKAIESIVARPALTQSAKGILSSGLSKSVSYMYAKNSKYRGAGGN